MAKKTDRASGTLEGLPGIGPSLAADLRSLGIQEPRQLRGRSAEALYGKLCRSTGVRQDPCVLYAFRCAVYYASNTRHDPALLKWWNWKDRKKANAGRRASRTA